MILKINKNDFMIDMSVVAPAAKDTRLLSAFTILIQDFTININARATAPQF